MKKIMIGTPVVSIFIFIVFCLWFEKFILIYQVTDYQPYEVSIIKIDRNEKSVYFEVDGIQIEEDTKVRLIYSDKKPALKGVVKKSENQNVKVYFERLSNLSDEELQKALFEFEVGEIAIGEGLKLWK